MKKYFKALSGIILLVIISMNLKADVLTNSNSNEVQQIELESEDNASSLLLSAPEKTVVKSKQQAAETAFNLSVLAVNRDDLTLARSHIEEAIQLNNSNLDYLALATDIAFIAKEYARAEEYQVMMLLVAQSTLGLDNLRVAVILDQLAAINIKQKRYKQARFRLHESLRLREKVLGNNHLLIISSLNKLASLAIRQQSPAVAEPLLKRSLDIARKMSGPQHGNSAILLASLADLYQNEGRLEEAEIHYKEAISIWTKSSNDQSNRLVSQNSLGQLFMNQQRFDDARLQFEEVLSQLKQYYKQDHPYVQQAIENISLLDAEHKRTLEQELMYDELVRVLSFQLLRFKP